MIDGTIIDVVCEGAGHDRHLSRRIERFAREDGGWAGLVHQALGDATPSHRHERGGVERTARGWRFECPRCGVNARVPHRVVVDALDRLDAANLDRLDLATLNVLARNAS